MTVLFSLACFLLVLSAVIGYGALFVATAIAPATSRLEPGDASAVAQVTYRVGARRLETSGALVGPAGLAVVATSQDRLSWSAPWLWIALALWAATVVIRLAVMQPARRSALVILGGLAGSRSGGALRHEQLSTVSRRLLLGARVCIVLFVAAVAVVTFHPGG